LRKRRRRSVGRDIQTIRKALASISRALGRLAPSLTPALHDSSNAETSGRRLRLSAARRAALKLQGQYMGHLRSLKPRQRTRVKSMRVAKGVRAAIGLAKSLSRGAPGR